MRFAPALFQFERDAIEVSTSDAGRSWGRKRCDGEKSAIEANQPAARARIETADERGRGEDDRGRKLRGFRAIEANSCPPRKHLPIQAFRTVERRIQPVEQSQSERDAELPVGRLERPADQGAPAGTQNAGHGKSRANKPNSRRAPGGAGTGRGRSRPEGAPSPPQRAKEPVFGAIEANPEKDHTKLQIQDLRLRIDCFSVVNEANSGPALGRPLGSITWELGWVESGEPHRISGTRARGTEGDSSANEAKRAGGGGGRVARVGCGCGFGSVPRLSPVDGGACITQCLTLSVFSS